MKNTPYIREMRQSDLPKIKSIIDDNQMFPSEYLDDMASSYFSQATQEMWFVAQNEQADVIAVAYCSPDRMTDGTWNLLLIAVLRSFQGCGIGSDLMTCIENTLKETTARVLLVETSGLPEYKRTRDFYPKCGYTQVAVIPEYYDRGDDKIVFWKSLIS